MIIPPAEMIEQARDQVRVMDPQHRAAQQRELTSAAADADDRFRDGYEIGLQTARVFLAGNPAALKAGVQF